MSRSGEERLRDISTAAEKCRKYYQHLGGAEDDMVFDAISRNLEIIGEAAKHLSEAIQNRHQDIPWDDIVGLRNMLAHEYFRIDAESLRRIVEVHFNRLLQAVRDELC